MGTKTADSKSAHVATATTLRLISEAQQAWTATLEVTDGFVVAAARATYAAHVDGVIGKGQRFENSTEFGLLFPDRDGNGASKSTVTRWRRLGAALEAGIEPGSQTWARLVSKANDPRIGSVLDSENVTVRKVETAVRKCFPRGKFAPAVKDADKDADKAPGESNGNNSPASEREEPVPNGVPGMLTMLDKIAARLEGTSVTPAEGKRLAAILARFETVTVAGEAEVLDKRSA